MKAQAVAARTYAVKRMGEFASEGPGYQPQKNGKPIELLNFTGKTLFNEDLSLSIDNKSIGFNAFAKVDEGTLKFTPSFDFGADISPPKISLDGIELPKLNSFHASATGTLDAKLVIDAGMNDLLRPALYQAKHRVEALDRPPPALPAATPRVVGPVCESSDDFGAHPLGEEVPSHVVLRDAGAYGFTMASEYNGRPLPSEVFVKDGKVAHVSRSPGHDAWIQRRLNA